MRRASGWVVLMLGTAGLGWWAHGHQARDIEAEISAAARNVAEQSVHGVSARVSGRDIVLEGLADTRDEQKALIAALEGVEGRRVVHADQLEILPAASPYHFEARKAEDGALSASGVMPTAAAAAAINGVQPGAELALASGAPVGWGDAVGVGLRALAPLDHGTLTFSDQTLRLEGAAQSPAELAATEAALSQLPEGFAPNLDITLVDDGAPASYAMRYDATTGLAVKGRVPQGSSGASFGWALGVASTDDQAAEDIAPEAIAAADLEQNNALMAAIAPQMKSIERFSLDVVGVQPGETGPSPISADLTIETRPDADAAAVEAAIRAALPEQQAANLRLGVGPVGPISGDMPQRENQITGLSEYLIEGQWVGSASPYLFAAETSGAGAQNVSGHVPGAVAREELALLLGAEADKLAPAHGAPEGWSAAAIAGLNALAPMQSGSLTITDQKLRLSGKISDPVAETELRRALSFVPEGYEVETDLLVLDDGLPADFSVAYAADKGVRVDGRLPRGLTGFDLGDALGLAAVEDHSTADSTEEGAADYAARGKAVLATMRSWLPQMESFQIDFDGPDGEDEAATRARIALSPGADAALVDAALSEALDGQEVSLEVAATEPLSQSALTSRINAATGETERLSGGFWLPVRDFVPSLEECDAQADGTLAEQKIGFVSGSAQLDAEAARAVNLLAAVMGPCLESGLSAELGGHTDSTGSAEGNQKLSQERAEAVMAALVARGLEATALSARGYGPDQPIADNATEAGRAENRRTEVTWSAPEGAADAPATDSN